ncbi:SMK killer toxin resistance protein [Lodderomyces elongisporus]|uniref:SMK killer toxin resistance protein n=1 Tax=Lodderomyces elongisporus TaxID=36914 RepID=UPI00291F30F3|nr:SMK killer toxin resistance protein [Lodderomyces elongisporus]WLF76567.1 SMK killer toxin resistance protein [Lodderomyces elongisporus]
MFIIDLWESIFTPGTTPALITATHGSFILLISSLLVLIYVTKSIHFFNLLVIAVLLYGTVIWFISELQKAKLQSNEELNAAKEKKDMNNQENQENQERFENLDGNTTSVPVKVVGDKPRKRKV